MLADVIAQVIGFGIEMSDMSVKEIAKEIGVNYRQVYRWRNGETLPDILTFFKLCELLKIDISKFHTLKDVSDLSLLDKKEIRLIKYYRRSSKMEQEKIIKIIQALEE